VPVQRCYNCSTGRTEQVNISTVQSTEQLCVVHLVSSETDFAAVLCSNCSNHMCYVYLYSD